MMSSETEMEGRLRTVEMAQSTHEAVCAERYAGIRHDINSITKILKQVGLALIAGMAAILAKLVFHG
jgi:hypothetical protein